MAESKEINIHEKLDKLKKSKEYLRHKHNQCVNKLRYFSAWQNAVKKYYDFKEKHFPEQNNNQQIA